MNAPIPAHLLPRLEPRPVPAAMLDALKAHFGERCSTALAVREQHGRDESPIDAPPPEVVVFCESTEDVAAVVKLADRYAAPVIPFGVGSSLEGHLLAVQGGVSIDLSRMNRILALHPEDLTVTVQAGVTRNQLNDEIRHTGLFFPIDPGADASLGGMSATRASGTNAVRYGTMRENVLGLTVVTAQGEVIHTGTRARKSAAGYAPLFTPQSKIAGRYLGPYLAGRPHPGAPDVLADIAPPPEDLATQRAEQEEARELLLALAAGAEHFGDGKSARSFREAVEHVDGTFAAGGRTPRIAHPPKPPSRGS